MNHNCEKIADEDCDLGRGFSVVDIHANKKGEHFSDKDKVSNDLGGDGSPAERVNGLVWLDHEVWINEVINLNTFILWGCYIFFLMNLLDDFFESHIGFFFMDEINEESKINNTHK